MRRTARTSCSLLACGAWTALLLVAQSLLAQSLPAAEPKTWDLAGRGQWAEVRQPQPTATQPVANAELDKAEQLLAADNPSRAQDVLLDWIRVPQNRLAPDRDRALFLLADAYYRKDERITAFYHLDELLDFYPESRFFSPALEKQFRIADEFLKGHKRKLLGFRVLSAEDEAIDMLFRIQERAPGSPLAERALRRTADHYFATSQFELAGDAYAAYARSYPRSPQIGRVRLQQAFSSFARFHGTRFDSTPLIDARAQFEDVKVRYPDLAEQANVQKFIDTINQTLARKLLGTADYYSRTSKPKAAAYTLLTLMATYPRTPAADQARADLQRLPKWAVEQAGQVKASEPATRPIGPETPAELRTVPR